MAENKFLSTAGVSRLWKNVVKKVSSSVEEEKQRALQEEARLEEKIDAIDSSQTLLEADGVTIDLVDNTLTLHGFEGASERDLPIKAKDGRLEWTSLDTITKGDGNKVTTLVSEDNSVIITQLTNTADSLVYDLSITPLAIPEYKIVVDKKQEDTNFTIYRLVKDGNNVDAAIVVPNAYDDSTLVENLSAEKEQRTTEDERLLALIRNSFDGISAIEERLGEVPEGKTIMELINSIEVSGSYDDTAIRALIAEETIRAETEEQRIIGLIQTETVRAEKAEGANRIAINELNAILEAALDNNSEGLDSIKELAVWIEEHESEVLPVINAHSKEIASLADKIDTGDKTVTEYVQDTIAAMPIPIATVNVAGLVKASDEVAVGVDGRMSIGSISTDKLVQGEMTLILDGGDMENSAN